MPTRAPTACTTPGCPNPQPCPAHPRNRWANGTPGRRMPTGWPATRRRILNRDGWACRTCGRYAAEVDHIIERAAGGSNDDSNLQSLCGPCHRAKTSAQALEIKAGMR